MDSDPNLSTTLSLEITQQVIEYIQKHIDRMIHLIGTSPTPPFIDIKNAVEDLIKPRNCTPFIDTLFKSIDWDQVRQAYRVCRFYYYTQLRGDFPQ